ncbi:hypothetical protein JRQ81_017630, partial [Phrynocephalus forsythii]
EGFSSSWPATPDRLAQLAVHLYFMGLPPRTIQGGLSALAFYAKAQCFEHPPGNFLLQKVLEGWSKERGKSKDNCAPFTPEILSRLTVQWPVVCDGPVKAALFRAAALVAFFAALRISELLVSSKSDLSYTALLRSDLSWLPEGLLLCIRSTRILWSALIPRLVWRSAHDPLLVDEALRRVNGEVANFLRHGRGFVIAHPGISGHAPHVYGRDRVQLSDPGLDIFLSDLRGGLRAELLGWLG